MNPRIHINFAASIVIGSSSCASKIRTADKAETLHRNTEWAKHSQDPVPNIFGDKTGKKPVGNGFYEQSGSVASNSSWESVAHYTYLAYGSVKIGIASYPYSISPSGRFVIIPETYYHGAKAHKLKIYDKISNRFILREVDPMLIRGYKWAEDERSVTVLFEDSVLVDTLSIPHD